MKSARKSASRGIRETFTGVASEYLHHTVRCVYCINNYESTKVPSKDTVQYYFMIDTKYGSTKVLSKVQIKLFIRVHVLYCTTTTTVLVSIDRATRTCSSRVALNMIIDNLIM